jgi:hypothetical protein
MNVPTDRARRTDMVYGSPRLDRLATADSAGRELVGDLLDISVRGLPLAFADGEFVFRLDGTREQGGGWTLRPSGTSHRYGAITALGLMQLPGHAQRDVLGGEDCDWLIEKLAARLDGVTNLGDTALTLWAAAEAGHAAATCALDRLTKLDEPGRPAYVVEAAWVVSALVAARKLADVEEHLDRARRRLLAARPHASAVGPGQSGAAAVGPGQSNAAFPRVAVGAASWYRGHVGSFADQVYPVQALARLHASADDPEALAVAGSVAKTICTAQGTSGQWWWHYDSRTGSVVEGYPVYSVHQHAMAPMALLDLADAGGTDHLDAICRGLRWMTASPEATEPLILDDPPTTWRKVARADKRKAVRGIRAASTKVRPGWRLSALDRMFPPTAVDHECRPYELGWLLYTWLGPALDWPGPAAAARGDAK